MESERARDDVVTLRDYLAVARRRKWTILFAAVAVPAVAVALSLRQDASYAASADVFLSRTAPSVFDPNASVQPDRFVNTQAEVAASPVVAQRAVKALGLNRSAQSLLQSSTVSPVGGADILRFSVTDPNRELVTRLARAYALAFVAYRKQLDTRDVARVLGALTTRIEQLQQAGQTDTPLYTSLLDRREQLRASRQAAAAGSAQVIRASASAQKLRPNPVRNGVLAVGLGVILGILLAFLREALDTRVRSAGEVRGRLGLPLLARLPTPRRRSRGATPAVLAEPSEPAAEAYAMLRTNLELANRDRGARVIMFTSAIAGEGKSSTVANLAVALARAGRRVILVDLDLRRPSLGGVFGADQLPGVTDVVLGRASLDDALLRVTVGEAGTHAVEASGKNGHAQVHGMFELLVAGDVPEEAAEFVGARPLGDILNDLRARAEIVLVDTPGALEVSDPMTLSTEVDAVVVVVNLKRVRRAHLAELRRSLEGSPAAKLGFVATAAEVEEGLGTPTGAYHYGRGTGTSPRRSAREQARAS